jgi:endoribonuclease LACTB2
MLKFYNFQEIIGVEGIINTKWQNFNVYTYLVDGMLIDTGSKSMENKLLPYYNSSSFNFVVLTHHHEDHTGNAAWIQKELNVPIYIHPLGVDICSKPINYPEYRQNIWGCRKPFNAQPLGKSISSESYEWKVIYTPGHAEDHVSLLNEETGQIFTGDLFVSPKTKLIMTQESIPNIIESLRKLLTYDFQEVFCSHYGYISQGKIMLKRKLDYLENISAEIIYLHNHGYSIEEISQKLFPKKYPIIIFSEGEWNSFNIIRSVLMLKNSSSKF